MKRLIALLVLGLSLVAGSAGVASAMTDLILHLEFEGDFLDISGNALHGAPTGTPSFVADGVDRGYGAGLFGQALKLCDADAIADFVTVAHDPLLDVTSLTLMAWVKVTRFGPEGWWGAPLIDKPGAILSESDDTGRVHFTLWTDPLQDMHTPTSLKTGLWHHIAATYEETTGVMNFYVDGLLDATVIGPGGPIAAWPGIDLTIGDPWGGAQGTVALIDEVRIYNRALTLGEIQAVSKIPEPATLLLLGLGLSGLAVAGKKKKK